MAALEKLAEMPRGEKEPALPAIKAILNLVECCKLAREGRDAAKKSERLVRWQCPSCKATRCGFKAINDPLFLTCFKKFWSQAQEQELECGTAMVVIFDDAADRGEPVPYEAPAWATKVGQ